MRVLISGGGTGGHVYPALAVAAQLARAAQAARPFHAEAAPAENHRAAVPATPAGSAPDLAMLWVGGPGGMEKDLAAQAGIPFRTIHTGQLRGINPLTALINAGKMMIGVGQSLGLVAAFQPQVCFVTGGYVCTPVVIACRMRRVPVLIYLPDMTPGFAVRWLSRLTQRVAVTFAEAAAYFGAKAVVTGYPVRKVLVEAAGNRRLARRQLAQALGTDLGQDGQEQELPLLLVFGGSQGSRSINRAMWAALPEVLHHAHVLHVIGTRDWDVLADERPVLPADLAPRYHAVAYLHGEMPLALAAADLAVARAGASTLGEFPVARLPSILVPLPIAGGHQWANAGRLAGRGGAVVIDDADLRRALAPTLLELLQDRARRAQMEAALADLAHPQAALCIAQELVNLARPFGKF